MRKQTFHKLLLLIVGLSSLGLFLFAAKPAVAANPTTINFQGKIVNANGTNVANGTYSFIFRIYNTASPTMTTSCTSTASCLWQETQASVTVTNGVFQVELGASCALTSGSCNNSTGGPINFTSTSSLYLTLQYAGDTSGANGGFMSPTIHLTSAPFALNADNATHVDAGTVTTLGVGDVNATAITIGNTTNSSILFKTKQVAAAFQVQNGASNEILTIDTSATEANNFVRLGKTSTINGRIVFDNSSNTNTVTLVSGATGTSYTLTLPTTVGNASECLKNSGTAGILTFGSCGVGGGGTLAADYTSGSSATDQTILLTSGDGGGVLIQDASSPLGGNLFAVQKNAGTVTYLGVTATGINIQSNATGSAVNALAFDTSTTTPHLKIFGSNGTSYADIYYDVGTTTAFFAASTGTTTIGSGSGPISIDPGGTSAFTIVGHAASSITTDTSSALTITAAAASTWSTSSGLLTLQGGTGVSLLSATSTTATVDSGTTGQIKIGATNTTNAKNVTIGNANSGSTVDIESGTGTTGIEIGNTATAHGIQIGSGGAAAGNAQNVTIGSQTTSTNSKVLLQGGNIANSSGVAGVFIGNPTADANMTPFQLDSDSNFSSDETNGTNCTTAINQGAMYYNTTSNAVRGCINGGWEDMVSTASLGLQLFGVVPDSGSAVGDLAGVTGLTAGPCKVSEGGTTSTVSWTACVAFSGGRKVIVTAGTAATSVGGASLWQHLCLTAAGNQPALSAIGVETANLATVSMTAVANPILCLADIKVTNGSAVITGIYNTATYTTTNKEFASAITTAPVLGQLVQTAAGAATPGSVNATITTANLGSLKGVIVATTGSTSTSTVNAIVATSGPAWVKSIAAGTGNGIGHFIQSTATAGYANSLTTPTATNIYSILGLSRTAFTTACAINSLGCNSSVLTTIAPR